MENTLQPSSKVTFLKNLYLYVVSFVALMMVVFSLADLINVTLRTYVFTKADNNYYSYPMAPCPVVSTTESSTPSKIMEPCLSRQEQDKLNNDNVSAQRQRDLVRDISMIIVGIPLFAYHWWLIRRKE